MTSIIDIVSDDVAEAVPSETWTFTTTVDVAKLSKLIFVVEDVVIKPSTQKHNTLLENYMFTLETQKNIAILIFVRFVFHLVILIV